MKWVDDNKLSSKGSLLGHNGVKDVEITGSGSNNNILVSDSSEQSGFKWETLPNSTVNKGDLLTHDGSNQTILSVGSNGQALLVDDSEVSGLKWVDLVNGMSVKTVSSDGQLDNNTITIAKGGSNFTVDSNAPNSTRWRLVNRAGGGNAIHYTLNGYVLETLREFETLDIYKQDDEILLSPLRGTSRITRITSDMTVRYSDKYTTIEALASNNDITITLPTSYLTEGRIHIKNVGDLERYNVKVVTNGSDSIDCLEDGTCDGVTIGEGSSYTVESNRNGAWNIIDSHVVADRRLYHVNPFGYSNLSNNDSDVLINQLGVKGRLYLFKDTANANILQLDAYQGVNRKSVNVWDMNEKVSISSIGLNTKSFALSVWLKIDNVRESNKNFYFVGNHNTSFQRNQALHIGWRDNDTFTVGFYANDINIDLTSDYHANNFIGKDRWVHVGVKHDANNHKSKVWINGNVMGEEQHAHGSYGNVMDLLFGTMNVTRMSGKCSHFRILVTTGNQSISSWDLSDFYKLEKLYFKGVL